MDGYILIVDNRKVFRASIKNILIKKGYKTIGVDNGKTAYQRILQRDVDLVILKHNLPIWSGLKTVKKIKSKFKDIDIICIADDLADNIRKKYEKYGVTGIVPKRIFYGETEKFINDILPDKVKNPS